MDMRLTTIRNMRGLTLRDLADMVGVNASTIQRAEVMDKTAKLATYKACADALGVTLSDIFCDDRSLEEKELIRAFRAIPADRHPELIALLKLAGTRPEPSDQ